MYKLFTAYRLFEVNRYLRKHETIDHAEFKKLLIAAVRDHVGKDILIANFYVNIKESIPTGEKSELKAIIDEVYAKESIGYFDSTWYLIKYEFKNLYLVDKILTFYYNIKYGIYNIFRWAPVIWKDRDWDYYYLYKVIDQKLKFMIELQIKHGNSVDHMEYAKEMQECVELIKSLQEDDYDSTELDKVEAIYGKREISFGEPDEYGHGRITFTRNGSEEESEEERLARSMAFKKGAKIKTLDRYKLFLNIAKNIERWWD